MLTFSVKSRHSFFNGSLPIEEFLNHIAKIDRFLDYVETLPKKRVRLVVCHLKREHLHVRNEFSLENIEMVKILYELGIE